MATINVVFENGLSASATTVYDTVAPKASPTFTGTVVLPSTTSIGTVSATEISYVDGVTSSIQTQLNAKASLASPTFTGTAIVPNITMSGSINDVSATELNVLNGVASTLTSAELNILDGVTANKDELNILDGALLSTTELNVLDGLTATTTQLNYVAGVTSAIQTQLNGKNALPVYKGNFPVNQAELDFVTNDVVKLTISANTTVTSTVPTAGNRKTLIILTSGGTSRTVTFGAGFLATANLATGTVTGNHFVISFVSDGDKLIETSRTIAM
jgi:hypothetical protein